jgi:hypothetical protein
MAVLHLGAQYLLHGIEGALHKLAKQPAGLAGMAARLAGCTSNLTRQPGRKRKVFHNGKKGSSSGFPRSGYTGLSGCLYGGSPFLAHKPEMLQSWRLGWAAVKTFARPELSVGSGRAATKAEL